jgi:hypothetical protein
MAEMPFARERDQEFELFDHAGRVLMALRHCRKKRRPAP